MIRNRFRMRNHISIIAGIRVLFVDLLYKPCIRTGEGLDMPWNASFCPLERPFFTLRLIPSLHWTFRLFCPVLLAARNLAWYNF